MNTEKKQSPLPVAAAKTQAQPKGIRLVPCKTDYETWARRTAIALGKDPEKAALRKPNAYFLSLMNLGS